MTISFGQRLSGVLLSAALASSTLASVAARPASAQDPQAVVQPGAPGQPTRTLTAEEAAALRPLVHVEADVRFMQRMMFHHAQALEMTDLLSDRTDSAEMRLLAQRITISQTAEMGMMKRWLESRGEESPDLEDEETWPLSDDQLMPGMLNERQMVQLAAARSEQFDRFFLELMILHHEGALTMVGRLFSVSGAGQEPQIFQYVAHVDADQSIEIGRMSTMLLARR